METFAFEAKDLTTLPSFTYGQFTQFKHFFIPLTCLCDRLFVSFGTFERINLSPIVGGLLYATIGGLGNISLSEGSEETIVL